MIYCLRRLWFNILLLFTGFFQYIDLLEEPYKPLHQLANPQSKQIDERAEHYNGQSHPYGLAAHGGNGFPVVLHVAGNHPAVLYERAVYEIEHRAHPEREHAQHHIGQHIVNNS